MDTFFTEYDLLEDKLCNVLCDQILGSLREQFKDKSDMIVLSGRLALNLHEKKDTPIRNIVFITQDKEIFDYHQKNARMISPSSSGVIMFKKRTLVNFSELYLEFWLTETVDSTMFNRLPIQIINQIPNTTL